MAKKYEEKAVSRLRVKYFIEAGRKENGTNTAKGPIPVAARRKV
jgi:hypothetical protein